ncbi:MAG: MMPL family transporter [Acidiferrobacteraceae bacterium]|jgi:predicted exporter
MNERTRRLVALGLFGVAVLVCLLLVATRLRIQGDLAAFLPNSRDPQQTFVINEFKSGIASRFWLLAIRNAEPDALARLSQRYAARLRASGSFIRIYDGAPQLDAESREILFRYRYLLDSAPARQEFSVASLRKGFDQVLQDLRSPLSTLNQAELIADPTGAFRRAVALLVGRGEYGSGDGGSWMSANGKTAFLLAEAGPKSGGFARQQRLLQGLRGDFRALGDTGGARLTISGPPYFTVVTEARVRREIVLLSGAATVFVVLLLLWVYRSIPVILLAAVPVAGGLLLAGATMAGLWGWAHGISVAFGSTLVGVALDYPIHLFSHARPGESLIAAARRIWLPLRIGAITTILGFSAMIGADFPGIQQLGVFAIAGLLGAILVTRYGLPALFATGPTRLWPQGPRRGVAVRVPRGTLPAVYGLIAVGAVGLFSLTPNPWSDDISKLTPVPDSLKQADRKLREEMNLPEPRYVVLVRGKTAQAVLEEQRRLAPVLGQSVRDGLLADSDMAANIVPDAATQRARQQALPSASQLATAVDQARQGTIFRPKAFEPFIADVVASSSLRPLRPRDLGDGIVAERVAQLIRSNPDGVIGIIRLIGVRNAPALEERIRPFHGAGVSFLDMKKTTEQMVGHFRAEIVDRAVIVIALIIVTLLAGLRDYRRTLHVIAPVAASVTSAAMVALLMGGGHTVFHLVSLMLVAGIGVDYALFATQEFPDEEEFRATRRSLMVCGISTIGVFGILATSSIPVLHEIGVTVASGTLVAYLLSLLLTTRGREVFGHG